MDTDNRGLDDCIEEKWELQKEIDELKATIEKEREWISIEKDLPEETENVLWLKAPVCEPPYCGSMLDTEFMHDYYTHWKPLQKLPNYVL
jgi:hypothetical protein